MAWEKFLKNKWTVFAASSYFLVSFIFIVWMVFFDTNSFLIHRELQGEIDKLEQQKKFLEQEIAKDEKLLEELKNPEALEKYAREKYYMKKKNEEVFLIEHEDGTKQ